MAAAAMALTMATRALTMAAAALTMAAAPLDLWALAALALPLLLGLRRRRRRLIRDAAVAGQKLAMKKDRPLAAGPSKFV